MMMVYVRIIVRRESTANDDQEGIQNVPMYEIKCEMRESTLSGINHRNRETKTNRQTDRQIKIIKREENQDKKERLAASSMLSCLFSLPSKMCTDKSHLVHRHGNEAHSRFRIRLLDGPLSIHIRSQQHTLRPILDILRVIVFEQAQMMR